MKKFVALSMALALVGCNDTQAITRTGITDQTKNFEAICIDGVQYWLSDHWGSSTVMSPRISHKTGRYMACPVVVKPEAQEIAPSASEGIDVTGVTSQM